MLRELVARPLAARSAVGAHDLAGLHDLLEPAQVVIELLMRLLAEVLGHRPAQRPRRDVVGERHTDLGATVPGGRHEPHLTGVLDVGIAHRAPGDPPARLVQRGLGIPLHALTERSAAPPVAAAGAGLADVVQMHHEGGQPAEVAPERVGLRRRPQHRGRARQLQERLPLLDAGPAARLVGSTGAFVTWRTGNPASLMRVVIAVCATSPPCRPLRYPWGSESCGVDVTSGLLWALMIAGGVDEMGPAM